MQLNVQSVCDSMSTTTGCGSMVTTPTDTNICAGCNQPITEKYLLKALEEVWHEDCLKCSCCDCRLGEVGSSLFVKANLLLCKQDYFRLFGMPGHCSACLQPIPAFEMVMRAREHVYHIECFACHFCNLRFCVGDKFYLFGHQIVCEEHCNYERRKDTPEEIPRRPTMVDTKDNHYQMCNKIDIDATKEHHNLHNNNIERHTAHQHGAAT